MFTTFIVQPIFNLLVLIYNIIPGHNFGLAVILFTIVVRMALWPLVKRQLHQTKLMRKLQPELKRIKKEAKGDRQKESMMMMELYKERGVSVFASFKVLIIQLPILFGLYLGLTRILKDPHEIVTFAYPWLQHFSWMKELAGDIHKFDTTLFHVVDLTRPALTNSGVYWPAMVLVVGSAVVQYFQSKQLLPADKDSKSLRQILKSAGDGQAADQSEVSAAVGRSTLFLLPAMIFIFTVHLASALSLYWLVSGIVAFIQQSIILGRDVDEMEDITDRPGDKLSDKSGRKQAKAKVIAKPSPARQEKAAEPARTFAKKSGSTVTSVTSTSGLAGTEKAVLEGEVVAKKSQSGKSKPHAKRRRK